MDKLSIEFKPCICDDPDFTGQRLELNPLTKEWMIYNPRKLWKCAGPQCQFNKTRTTGIVPLPKGFTNKKFYGSWNY